MKLRYVAKTTEDGYSFVFRNVLEFKFMAEEKFLRVQLDGKRLELNGITSFEGGGDYEPHLPDFKMIPPKIGGEGADHEEPSNADPEEDDEKSRDFCVEFRRESAVPLELATTTFAPLEVLH